MKINFPVISFWFFIVWILSEPYITTMVIIVAAFLHEAGHLTVSRLCKVKVSTITIYPLGADIHLSGAVSYRDNMLISIAGPMMNIITFIFLQIISVSLNEPYCFIADQLSASSISLAVINLLPVKGFDGANILGCMSMIIFPENMALLLQKITSCITLTVLWIVSLYLLLTVSSGISLFALCAFLFSTVYLSK